MYDGRSRPSNSGRAGNFPTDEDVHRTSKWTQHYPSSSRYNSSLNPTISVLPWRIAGARRFPEGPTIKLDNSSSVGLSFRMSMRTIFLLLVATTIDAARASRMASAALSVSFLALTSVVVDTLALARNSCVFLQVFQLGR